MRIFFKDYFRPLLFALLIALIHFGLWWVVNRALPLIDAPRIVHGFARPIVGAFPALPAA